MTQPNATSHSHTTTTENASTAVPSAAGSSPVTDERSTTNGGNPNAPPAEEAVAAVFATREAADRVVTALTGEGVPSDYIVELSDRNEKMSFLKRYVHRDGDRHTHGGVAAVFSGLLGALAMAMIAVATIGQYMPESYGPPLAGLIGVIVGGGLGALLGGIAFRTVDDSSIEIIETMAAQGHLVAVRRPLGSTQIPLDQAGCILERHNGRAVRMQYKANQADLHPGDLRDQNKQGRLLEPANSPSTPAVPPAAPR